jgi:serine carboxypeptidase-like clade I
MILGRAFSLVALLAISYVSAAPLEDLIEKLPLYGRPPSSQFSGYLDATPGCDTSVNGAYCKIHYWLTLAETSDWKERPVVLWLNGGPGSSSILGLLQENGSLLINATGGLMQNPWAWTKLINLLVIEAPIGVGYSYCEAMTKGQLCQNTDRYTASASRAALQDFFSTKFPELADNEFFITGESYAGVYIPTLSQQILDNAPEIKLRGIAVGDPCTDNTAQADSMDALWYGHKYGLVDDEIFDLLWNKCKARAPNLMRRGGVHHVAEQLNAQLRHLPLEERKIKAEQLMKDFVTPDGGPEFNKESKECTMAFRKFVLGSSKGLSQSWEDLYIDDYSLFAPVSNDEDEEMAAYMMRDDVRKALHVEDAPTKTWPYADIGFDYTKEYDACNEEVTIQKSMVDIYQDIVKKLHTTYIYNGDTDPCVSYEGTRIAVKQIGFDEIDGGGYRPWFYNHTAAPLKVLAEKAALYGPDLLVQDMGSQFAGEVVNYDHGLSFLTFHGSGHMVRMVY